MKLINASIGHNGKAVTTAKGKRYQVRWWLDPGSGRPVKERKLSTFRTKGECDLFIERLTMADYGVKGWIFDSEGNSVQGATQSSTFFVEIGEYAKDRWKTDWQDAQRNKVRGRLLELVALTVTRPTDRSALLAALDEQRLDRGRPPQPTTTIGRAARYLRRHAFLPDDLATERPAFDDHDEAGRRWLEAQSMPISATDKQLVTALRGHYTVGRPYSTARTYWSGVIVPFLNWLNATEKLGVDPHAGQTRQRRDSEAERPDRRRIPDPRQLICLADDFGARHGEAWELWMLVSGFCALRLSESLAVRLDSFFRGSDGRMWLDVNAQIRRVVAATSDDGKTTKRRSRTKSTRWRTPPPRPVPVPRKLARRLEAHFGDELCNSTRYAFVGPRGAVGNDTTVRAWWDQSVKAVFGDDPSLAGITPHVLRHAGMTYWFAVDPKERDDKLIQQWGGWQSLKEMLDTYRGVIRSLETNRLDGVDEFYEHWSTDPETSGAEPTAAVTELAEVIDIASRRDRQQSIPDQHRIHRPQRS